MHTQRTGAPDGAAQTLAGLSGARLQARGAEPGPAARRAHPAVAVAVGVALLATLAGSVTLPVLLGSRTAQAGTTLRAELTDVDVAQQQYRDRHGGYADDLAALALPAGDHDLALVRAGQLGYCVGAYDGASDTTLFYSPAEGFSSRSCG